MSTGKCVSEWDKHSGGGAERRHPLVVIENDLANESQVVVAAGGIRDGRAAVDFDGQSGLVQDVTAIDVRIIAVGIADRDRAADVAAAVDITSGYRAAVARSRGHAAVTGARDVVPSSARRHRLRTENRRNGSRKIPFPYFICLALPRHALPQRTLCLARATS